MPAKIKKLDELFHDTLKDIYYAEKKILGALPKMAKAARDEQLKEAFEKHHGQTEEQVDRLEAVFDEIDEKPQGKRCDAIDGSRHGEQSHGRKTGIRQPRVNARQRLRLCLSGCRSIESLFFGLRPSTSGH